MAWRVLARKHRHLTNGRVLAQDRFNFPQLNAEPTNLDLIVNSAEKFDAGIRQKAHEIACSVQPCELGTERICDEFFGGEFALVPIAGG